MLRFKLAVLVLFSAFFSVYGQTEFDWHELPPMPPAQGESVQAGVAGAFSGLLTVAQEDGSSFQAAVVAGGANFPNTPLADGGKKVFQDGIFLLAIDGTNSAWQVAAAKIPSGQPVAYGASCQLSANELLLIGGQTTDGTASGAVSLLTLNPDQSVSIAPATVNGLAVPPLPVTAINASALLLGDTVWLIAGQQSALGDSEPMNRVFKLKLEPNEETGALEWTEGLALPGPMRSQHITVAQRGGFHDRAVFYVVSGISHADGTLKALSDGYAYLKPVGQDQEEWRPIAPVLPFGEAKEISLLGGKGMPAGIHNILFFGGYNKEVFNGWLAKTPEERKELHGEFLGQEPSAFKWNRKVLSYNTVTDTWTTVLEMPDGMLPNCGAAAFKIDNDYFVLGGEIKPGVRTPGGFIFSAHHNPSFGVINWGVLTLYLVGMLMLGAFFMKREKGAEDFMKGGGRIPWWAAGVSIFATMLSSISFIAIPARTYVNDWRVFTAAITIALCVPVVTKIYLPFFRRLNVTSAYEYLELRFNAPVRSIASIVFIMYMVARIGIVLYLPSIALSAVTGIDIMTCIIVIGLITILYCAMGGIEAVVWGDFIQGIVLVVGAIVAVVWLVFGTEGGFSGFTTLAGDAGKLKTFDFAFDLQQPTFWVILFGGFFGNVVQYTSDQSVVQRYLTTKDEQGARHSLWLNGLLSVPVSIVFYAIGSALYTYYKTHPAEMNVVMEQADQIFPHFMMSKLPVGIAGLLIAAVFSATMSTLSSNINSAATAFTTDFYRRFFHRNADDHQALKICRISTVAVGLLGMSMAWAVNLLQSQQIFDFFNMVAGLMLSGLGAFFAMGILTRFVSGPGALLGFIGNCILLYFLKQAELVNGWLYSFIGMAITFILSFLFSLLLPNKKDLTHLTLHDIREMQTK